MFIFDVKHIQCDHRKLLAELFNWIMKEGEIIDISSSGANFQEHERRTEVWEL